MWDQRYSEPGYAFGTEPNDFLRSWRNRLTGKSRQALCIGEGEGRNAVWLATLGHQVTALDASRVGLDKALKLASERGVQLDVLHTDLAHYRFQRQHWDLIVAIFCHLPAPLRRQVHRDCVTALRPGGMLLLEAYRPQQLAFGTGGPSDASMMMTATSLREELAGLEFLHLEELVRPVQEGIYHDGPSAVVQLLAEKPQAAD